MLLSLVAGIVVADNLFYDRYAVPTWLDVVTWFFCFVIAVAALLIWRYRQSEALGRYAFPLFVSLFFFVVGLQRYASYAKDVHAAWHQLPYPPVNRGNPDEFDYVRWRWIQGAPDSTSSLALLRSRADKLRDKLVRQYHQTAVDGQTAGIIIASTLGDRSQLHYETRDLYAAAGASHLLALSGLHLSIIVGFMLTLLRARLLLSRWRFLMGAAVVVFIWFYAFLAGLPTSLVRAATMTSLFVFGMLSRRYSTPLQWLILTALLLLLVRPVFLFDVGAQLSFAAVAGILVIHRRIVLWAFGHWQFQLYWLQRHHLLWPLSLLSVSLAAQAFTLPLVAYYFHRLPLYAPLFNIVFIPVTTVLILGALVLLAVSFVGMLAPLALLLSRALSFLVTFQMGVMQFEVSLPGAVVHDFWSRKAQPQVVVYNNRSCPALHVIAAPDKSWLLTPQPDSVSVGMRYIASSFWEKRLTAAPVVLGGQHVIALDNGFKAVMIDGVVAKTPERHAPSDVDLLWLTHGCSENRVSDFVSLYKPELLVLDASLPRWRRRQLRRQAERVGVSVYDIAERGALKVKL